MERSIEQRSADSDLVSQAFQQTEESFARWVADVRDYAIFLLDRDGRVLTWNSGAERIKGYRRDEIVGQHFSSTLR